MLPRGSSLLRRFRGIAGPRPSAAAANVGIAAGVVRDGHFGRLNQRLRRRWRTGVVVDVGPHGRTAEEVVWTATGRTSRFAFHPGILTHPNGSVLIERWLDVLPLLMGALSRAGGTSGTTSLALGDCGTGRGLAFCDHRPGAGLIPDPVFVREDGYRARKRAFARRPVAWCDREPRALWRGQTSGWHDAGGRPVETWQDLPRVRLCRLARDPDHRPLIDAGITGVVQIEDPAAAGRLKEGGLMVSRVDWRRFPDWRYQIDIDGNTSAWEGLFVKLCTGSPVLKVASGFGFRQWYHDGLVPWTHFVPVEADLGDLAEKVLWLRRHDDRARAIGCAARALVDGMDVASETAWASGPVARAMREGL